MVCGKVVILYKNGMHDFFCEKLPLKSDANKWYFLLSSNIIPVLWVIILCNDSNKVREFERVAYGVNPAMGYALSSWRKNMFEKGDVVLYGTRGVYDITDVTTLDLKDVPIDRQYYVLQTRNNTGTIYIPVDGDTSRMRKLISKDAALELISRIADIEPLRIKNNNKPDAEYKEALEKNNCEVLLSLIKCIYFRRKKRLDEGKKVTVIDERYLKLAEDVLYQELGVVLDIPKDRVLDYLINKIEEH